MTVRRLLIIIAGINGFLAVALGAFGAHALKNQPMLGVFHTANQYHFYHTIGLLVIALLSCHFPTSQLFKWAGFLMLGGMIFFSGSLYLLVILDLPQLGMITPIGGILLLIAWLLLVFSSWKET